MMFEGHYSEWRSRRIGRLVEMLGGPKWFEGKRVLELAAGHGHVSAALAHMGAIPTAADGRIEHVEAMRRTLDGVEVVHLDQRYPYRIGDFDLVLHWGVLYHMRADRWMQDLADAMAHAPLMCLETEVCDSDDPDHILDIEESGYDQSMDGIGVRPSAAAVERFLSEMGVDWIRHDDAALNADIHRYDWKVGGTGLYIVGLRRFWMCQKEKK